MDSNITYNSTQNAIELGMYYQDYNAMMALTGILIGFGFFYFSIQTSINIAKGLK
jgi:hypothetical protein